MTRTRQRWLPFALLLVAPVPLCRAALLPVCPEGTCAYATIQAALDAAAPGDTVQLADGLYRGDGNRDLDFLGKAVTVRSASGDRTRCLIDCEGTGAEAHRGFWFHGAEGPESRLESVTILRGAPGVECWGDSPSTLPVPAIADCRVARCAVGVQVGNAGGREIVDQRYDPRPLLTGCRVDSNATGLALATRSAGVTVAGSQFADNTGAGVGASIFDGLPGLLFTDCRFERNGGTGFALVGSFVRATLQDCAAAYNSGEGISLAGNQDESYSLAGCTIVGNAGNGVLGPGAWSDHLLSVADCLIQDNGACGIRDSAGPYGVFISTSTISGNGADGIAYDQARKTFEARAPLGSSNIQGCRVCDNKGWGIRYYGYVCPGEFSISQNVLFGNGAGGVLFGGAAEGAPAQLVVGSNTIVLNRGPGVALDSWIPTTITHCIVAFNSGPALGVLGGPLPTFACSDLFGNEGGDWTPAIYDQIDLPGNFSGDPCFCDPAAGLLTLSGDSWCLPGRYPWGCAELVGALGQGCDGQGCAPVVPVLLSDFRARVAGDAIAISWRLSAAVDRAELRLCGRAAGNEWDVPFSIAPEGGYAAVDRDGLTALRSAARGVELSYVLQLASGSGWTLLGRQDLAPDQATVPSAPALRIAPNPFNPLTTLRFDLPAAGRARLAVYDLAGRLVRTLVDDVLPAGRHEALWDGRDAAGRALASGGYFARLESAAAVVTVRMGLVR